MRNSNAQILCIYSVKSTKWNNWFGWFFTHIYCLISSAKSFCMVNRVQCVYDAWKLVSARRIRITKFFGLKIRFDSIPYHAVLWVEKYIHHKITLNFLSLCRISLSKRMEINVKYATVSLRCCNWLAYEICFEFLLFKLWKMCISAIFDTFDTLYIL